MLSLVIVSWRRSNLLRFEEGVEVGAVDPDATPPILRAEAVMRQASFLTPAVD
jgi:hypothetical protein